MTASMAKGVATGNLNCRVDQESANR